MTNLPAVIDPRQLALGTGLEDSPALFTAYRMLVDGQHPLSVQEKLKNLGFNVPAEALIALRERIPDDEMRANKAFPFDVLTDPIADYHKAFRMQRERIAKLLEEEEAEGKYSFAVDQALLALQESASKLALLMQKLGYNPYANELALREKERGVSLSLILNATPEELRAVISEPIDGEVTEL